MALTTAQKVALLNKMNEAGQQSGLGTILEDLLDGSYDVSDLSDALDVVEALVPSAAGTAEASKLALLGANKNLDVLAVADGGLSLGSGAGTAITSTAAELNLLDGVTSDAASLSALQKFSETVAYGDFTDGGAAVGTYDITAGTIPVGATFLFAAITAVTGFAGDVSAALTLGDGSDVDRYNATTIDVFSDAANGIAAGSPSGVLYHDTEATITLTITTNADWTSVSAGSVTVEFYYLT